MPLWVRTGNVMMQRVFSGYAPKADARLATLTALFEDNQIGAAQRRGSVLQRLVSGIRAVLIQNLVLAYDDFVIRRVQSRVDGDNDGVASQRRSDRRIGDRAAHLPAGQNESRNAFGLQRLVEFGIVESVLGMILNLDVAGRGRNLGQPCRHVRRARLRSFDYSNRARLAIC